MRTMMVALGVAAMAAAAPAGAKDRVGYQAISAGSLTQAEQELTAERHIFPDRPELMLNLAAVYARTGRLTQARLLYGDVLERAPVAMDMADGTIESSHDLAHRGLSRLVSAVAAR